MNSTRIIAMKAYMKDLDVEITKVGIYGNHRTTVDFFKGELAGVIKSSRIHSLHSNLSKLSERLSSLEVFESVDVKLDVTSSTEDKYVADVVISVKESPVLRIYGGTFLQVTSSRTLKNKNELNVALRNPFGYGELGKIGKDTKYLHSVNEVNTPFIIINYSQRCQFVPSCESPLCRRWRW